MIILALLQFLFFTMQQVYGTVVPLKGSMPSFLVSTQASSDESSDKSNLKTRTNLTLLASINYNSVNYALGAICTKGIEIALNRIESLPNLLADYQLVVEPYDDECTQSVIVSKLINKMSENDRATNRFPLMMGTLCSGVVSQAQIIRHYNFSGVSAAVGVIDVFSNRRRYASFFPLSASPNKVLSSLVSFLARIGGWHTVAIVSDATAYFGPYESKILESMEMLNMSLGGIFKIPFESGKAPADHGIQAAVEDLKSTQLRIVIVLSNWQHLIACWLHRYRIYGPNYVFFGISFSQYHANRATPYNWCNESMLADVLKSTLFFGEIMLHNVYGPAVQDVTGLQIRQFDDMLQSAILDRIDTTSTIWQTWRTYCYEQVLFSAFWLDSTEKRLKLRNQTLSDWFSSGKNFQENGFEVVSLLRQSLNDVKFRGLQADYNYSTSESLLHSNGPAYAALAQVQDLGGNLTSPVVGIYKVQGTKLMKMEKADAYVVWRTKHGSPPLDREEIVLMTVPLLSSPLSAAIISFGSFCLASSVILLAIETWRLFSKKIPPHRSRALSNMIIIGNMVMLSHVAFLPLGAEVPMVQSNCKAIYFLIIVGTAMVMSSLTCKLELGVVVFLNWCERNVANNNCQSPPVCQSHNSSHNTPRIIKMRQFVNRRNLFMADSFYQARARAAFLASVFTCIVAILSAVWVADGQSITTTTKFVSTAAEQNENVTTRKFVYACDIAFTPTTKGLCLTVAALIGVLVLRSSLSAVSLRSKRFHDIKDWPRLCTCAFGKTSLMLGATTVATIFSGNATYLQAMLSFYVFTFTAINFVCLFCFPERPF